MNTQFHTIPLNLWLSSKAIKALYKKKTDRRKGNQEKKNKQTNKNVHDTAERTWSMRTWSLVTGSSPSPRVKKKREREKTGKCTVWEVQSQSRVLRTSGRRPWWLCFCRTGVSPPCCGRSAGARPAGYSSRAPRSDSSCRCGSHGAR